MAVDLWWFLLGGFRFLEPLAPSNQLQHGSQRQRTRPQSSGCAFTRTLKGSAVSFEFIDELSQTSMTSLRVRFRELHDGRGRGTAESCMESEIVVYWRGNPTNSLRQRLGCPVCSTSRGQPPSWCDLWRCREMITKLHFEGVRIPGPTPSTGTNPRTGRGVSRRHPGRRRPPNFYSTGTIPRTGHHWTAFLCPVIRRGRRHCGIPTGEK